jgi:alpha-galactosidase
VLASYAIYVHLRQQHPELMLEVCNDGGRMVDFGSASHADYFSITDTYDPLSNRRAFYDTSHMFPAAMLEDYVEKWPTPRIENFRYMLRSGMMGWLTIMQDTNAWTDEQHAAAKTEFTLYKNELRPLIRDADLYHISERPDGVHWDAIEYFDPRRGRGVVYAFRGTTNHEAKHMFALQGVKQESQYRLRFQDKSSPDRIVRGQELLSAGLAVVLPLPLSSELIFLDEVGK